MEIEANQITTWIEPANQNDSFPKENVTYKETRINPISYETAIRPVIQDSNPNLVSNVVIEILTSPLTVAPFQNFWSCNFHADPLPLRLLNSYIS